MNCTEHHKFQNLKACPLCEKEYDKHWKVVNHIRKTKDDLHKSLIKDQEEELLGIYLESKDDIHFKLNKKKNIFSGISYEKIMLAIARHLSSEELEEIRKERISSTMKVTPKTAQHNKNVADGVAKAWKDGKFHTPANIKARADGIKRRRSMSGKNNHMYGKPSPRGSGFGRGGVRADIGHYVRSTWEANICRVYKHMSRDYLYEPTRFEIVVDGEDCTYCPDMYFADRDYYYEIKGHAKSSDNWVCPCPSCEKNRKKIDAVRKEHGVRIVIVGHSEYKRFKSRFKPLLPNWED